MSDVEDLAILQLVRLKGRVGRAELAGPVDELVGRGFLVDAPTTRLTNDGRSRLAELLAAERATIDPEATNRAYERFLVVNAAFKPLISQWQMKRDSAGPDDVTAVLAEVDELHRDVVSVIASASDLIPRLATYADRLDAALRRAHDGDMSWLTRPMVDSYHTVWFELHEELIGLTGRTREEEAESGSAD
ncbi:MarR family transcriptional regulator [Mycolicibacterium hodleri]|uniref:MarR family transcriptional regulator n=1 Tax=Mycolicibacterium hodleri TaxID=49897 RepID=A0A502EBV9_9MYCO|nr:MarR family transcriptional regulator [Mycolicibacterium hodleri]TPG35163.1 MarR family transcriptional regulator [Mycolicibacterium hodleri]